MVTLGGVRVAGYRLSRVSPAGVQFCGDNRTAAGRKISCVEEIAYAKGYINKEQLLALAQPLARNQYGEYLINLVEQQG